MGVFGRELLPAFEAVVAKFCVLISGLVGDATGGCGAFTGGLSLAGFGLAGVLTLSCLEASSLLETLSFLSVAANISRWERSLPLLVDFGTGEPSDTSETSLALFGDWTSSGLRFGSAMACPTVLS